MNQHRMVDEFNDRYPVGTPVEYWPGVREGVGRRSRTRSEAQLLSGHTAVVWVEGHGSCIALTHIQPQPVTATAGDNQTEDTMATPDPRDRTIAQLRAEILVADKLAHDLHAALYHGRRQPERQGAWLTVRQFEELTDRVHALGSFANQVIAEQEAHR